MSAVDGIGSVVLETHNWGRTAKFFTALGLELDFETDHHSGQFRGGEGPTVFVVEIPEDREPRMRVVLGIPDADTFEPDPALEVAQPFEDTHWGTREMAVRDPDGRTWTISAPARP
ncbi:glyoxalase/bleomycin resistance/extradiol dioxygenase family protein [Actinomycetospora sp. TBRC 11914]|uniref:VOC family protein n=1 Tax=Actinomycetospora sp. TBRC 11914 TaxID=2729387 RepID=UPI00145E3EEF|nr:VOC family protein [Actinomycetospora sp. TBRC 11914]NMO93653.1 VOC family protein [Actinomycetospora sp. TBRC 11914]